MPGNLAFAEAIRSPVMNGCFIPVSRFWPETGIFVYYRGGFCLIFINPNFTVTDSFPYNSDIEKI
jgi:hypothetical protein